MKLEKLLLGTLFMIGLTSFAQEETGEDKECLRMRFLAGEELKIKHFKKVLEGNLQVYTFLIRNRLKIKFHSK